MRSGGAGAAVAEDKDVPLALPGLEDQVGHQLDFVAADLVQLFVQPRHVLRNVQVDAEHDVRSAPENACGKDGILILAARL